jgi:hypothetical protein
MGGATTGQEQSAQLQKQSAQHSTDLFAMGSPGMRLALGDFIKDLGTGGEPASVQTAFSSIRDSTNKSFDQEESASPMTTAQQFKQSGYRGGAGAEQSASSNALVGLEDARRSNMQSLQMQETNTGMQQRDYDLSQIMGMATGNIGQSFQFNSNALQAAQMNQQNPWGGAASGALAGASAGSAISPGWGTLAGGVIGGLGGYFGGGG